MDLRGSSQDIIMYRRKIAGPMSENLVLEKQHLFSQVGGRVLENGIVQLQRSAHLLHVLFLQPLLPPAFTRSDAISLPGGHVPVLILAGDWSVIVVGRWGQRGVAALLFGISVTFGELSWHGWWWRCYCIRHGCLA